VEHLNLNEESDALIWSFDKPGAYSSYLFYVVILYTYIRMTH
jgi:hypothetical protein